VDQLLPQHLHVASCRPGPSQQFNSCTRGCTAKVEGTMYTSTTYRMSVTTSCAAFTFLHARITWAPKRANCAAASLLVRHTTIVSMHTINSALCPVKQSLSGQRSSLCQYMCALGQEIHRVVWKPDLPRPEVAPVTTTVFPSKQNSPFSWSAEDTIML
jgi:hypothetical protein